MTQKKNINRRGAQWDQADLLDSTTAPTVVFLCPRCQSPDVEGTAWLHLNTNTVTDGVPLDEYWCPACEDTIGHLLRVLVATGRAEHGEGDFSAAVGAYLEREGWR